MNRWSAADRICVLSDVFTLSEGNLKYKQRKEKKLVSLIIDIMSVVSLSNYDDNGAFGRLLLMNGSCPGPGRNSETIKRQ